MQVILLQDVDKVGLRGDVVDVARGYARNYLLPRRLAETATPARVAELEKRTRAARAAGGVDLRAGARARRELEQAELRFEVKAGPTGSLFGSVTATDLADEIWRDAKIRVDRRKIELGEPIKKVGRYAGPGRALHRRDRRGGDAGRARGRRAAAGGGEPSGRGGPARTPESERRAARARGVDAEEPAADAEQ